MGGRRPYMVRKFYPHMIGEDAILWTRFIEGHPEYFDSVDYDFRVGDGASVPEDFDVEMSRMVTSLSQKRIDVLGWNDEVPTIVEVKGRVGLSTLGQVYGYRVLFMEGFTHIAKPKILVVCERISADDRFVMQSSGVPVVEV